MKIAIIGTAGRDFKINDKLTPELFMNMKSLLNKKMNVIVKLYTNDEFILISGGAAWSDHLAVQLFLENPIYKLILCLPSEFKNGKYVEEGFKSPGSISNYYHKNFQRITGINSLLEIQKAIDLGAEIKIFSGFKKRNIENGNCDIMFAFSWTETDMPASPGTKHTWGNSFAWIKFNISLFDLIDKEEKE